MPVLTPGRCSFVIAAGSLVSREEPMSDTASEAWLTRPVDQFCMRFVL